MRLAKQLSGIKWPTYDSQVWILFAGTIVATIGSNMVMPFLSIYMYEQMHISMTLIGLAFFIATLLAAVSSYVGGSLADRVGRKPLLVIGLVLQVLAYVLLGTVLSMEVTYWLVVAVLSLAFIIDGLYRPVPDVMIADLVEPEKRVEVYGLIRVGFNVGSVVGPVLGGALALLFLSYSSMFVIAAIGTAGYLLLALLKLRDTRPSAGVEKVRITDIFKVAGDRRFLAFALLSCLIVIPYSQMYSLLSVYASAYLGFNTVEIGGIFAVSGLLVVLFQLPITAAIKRFRMTSMLTLCCVIFAAGFGMIMFSSGIGLVYLSMVVITLAEMLWAPSNAALQANLSPESFRGRYFGFGNLMFSLGFAIGPLFGGLLKDAMGDQVPYMWLVIGGVFIVCAAGFSLLGKIIPEKINRPEREELTIAARAVEG